MYKACDQAVKVIAFEFLEYGFESTSLEQVLQNGPASCFSGYRPNNAGKRVR